MNYHDITKDDMKNGDGLRAVLWVAGCDHRCQECQNPITWDPNDGLLFDEKSKEELYELLKKDYISGITLSGGDPLFFQNREEITSLCKEIDSKFPNKTIWLYTGYRWEEIKDLPVMKYVDVCIDGIYICEQRDVKLWWRGSSNQRVIDVVNSIKQNEVVLFCE